MVLRGLPRAALVPMSGNAGRLWEGAPPPAQNGRESQRRPGSGTVAALLLCLPLSVFATGAHAQRTLVSNLDQANGGAINNQGLRANYLQGFSTGGYPDGYTLNSVDLQFSNISISNIPNAVSIRTRSSAGVPGSTLGGLTQSGAATTGKAGTVTFASSSGIALDPNTQYYLTIQNSSHSRAYSTRLQRTTSDAEDSGGASNWTISDRAWQTGNVRNGYRSSTDALKLRINGVENSPTVTLSVSNSGAVTEASGSREVTITATRSEAHPSDAETSLQIPIRVKSAGTTATQTDDYTLAGTISIAQGQSSGTTSFTVVDDSTDEPDETVVVELGPLSEGSRAGTNREITITITDDDATTVDLARTGSGAIDEGGTAEFTLTLGRGLVAGEVLAVPLSIAGGTVGTDYTLALTGTPAGVSLSGEVVTFTGGATASATVATVLLTAAQDDDTADERLTVSIPATSSGDAPILTATGLDGGATGSRTGTGVIAIIDDDGALATLSAPARIIEGEESGCAVAIRPRPGVNLRVNVALSQSGAFLAAEDTGDRTIAYRRRAPLAEYGFVTVDDETDEPDGTLTCVLEEGTGYRLLTADGANERTVAVRDNDPTIVSLPTADATIAEGDTTEFTVTLGRALVAGEIINVPLSIYGTGVTLGDWSLALETGNSVNMGVTLTGATTATPQLRFSGAAAQTATLVLTAATDSVAESEETITVALGPNDSGDNNFDALTGTNVGGGADPSATAGSFDVMVTNVAPTNSAPTVATAIPDQDATVGTAFSYAFPAGTFTDVDSDTLSYTATLSDGTSALPSWLGFDADSRTFSGTPVAGDIGTVNVRVTANDGNGGRVFDTFDIVVALPTVTVTRAASPVTEGAEAVFTVARTGATTGALTVLLGVGEDDRFGRDFVAPEDAGDKQVIIAMGDTTATYMVPTQGDAVDEPTGLVTMQIRDDAAYTTGTPATAFVVVNDDDVATVTLSVSGGGMAAEGGSALTLTATRSSRYISTLSGPQVLPIRVRTADTTAQASDYTLAGEISIPVGADSGTATFTVVEDEAVESVETVVVELGTLPEGVMAGTPGAVTITIADNDGANTPPRVVTQIPDSTAPTGVAFRYQVPQATFSDADSHPLSYTATLSDGTSALPSWLGFDADSRTFSGTPVAGDIGTVNVRVTANDGNGGRVFDTFDIVVIAGRTVSLTAFSSAVADEGDSGGTDYLIGVTLSEALTGDEIAFLNLCFSGTATRFTNTSGSDTDYEVREAADLSNNLTFPMCRFFLLSASFGTSGDVVSVRVIGDTVLERDETVTATLELTTGQIGTPPPSSPADFSIGRETVTFTIRNDENSAPTVATPIPDQTARAGTAFSYVVPEATFEDVDDDTLTYTATQGDGTTALPSWLTFTSATRTFSGVPGQEHSATWPIRVSADDGRGGVVTDKFDLVVSPLPVVTLTADPAPVTEGTPARFTLHRTGADRPGLTVRLRVWETTPDGEARPGRPNFAASDAVGFRSVTLAAGVAEVNFTVPTVTDEADEPDGAIWADVVENPGYIRGTPATARVGVNDDDATPNDAPTVATPIPNRVAAQGVAFSYVIPEGTFADADTDALTYTATLDDDDGSALPSWLTFTPGTRTFSGTPGSDDVGTVSVRVTADDGRGGTVTDTFDIVVNPAPRVGVLSTILVPVTEGTDAVVTVVRTGPTTGALTVLLLVGEDDLLGRDFVAEEDEGDKQLIIPAGAARATYSVPTVNDAVDEPTGSVLFSILDDPAYTVNSARLGAFAAVNDDDPTTVRLSVSGGGVAVEGGSVLTLTATRSSLYASPAPGPQVIPIQVRTAGTTAQASDYTLASEIRIAKGESSGTVTFTAADDSLDEGAETVVVELGTLPTDHVAVPPGAVTITIADTDGPNTSPTLATSIPNQSATEGLAFRYVVPQGTFSDADGDALTYTATLDDDDGSALPSWLSFTPASRTFSGTPGVGTEGTVSVRVTANDGNGGTVTDDFDIEVGTLAPQVLVRATGGGAVSEGADAVFTLTRTGPLTGRALVGVTINEVTSDGQDFVAEERERTRLVTFGFGEATIQVRVPTVNDAVDEPDGAVVMTGAITNGPVRVNVTDNDDNTPPAVATPIPDQAVIIGTAFSYVVPEATFSDADRHALTYTATLADDDGSALPSWLTFTPGTRTFSGTPGSDDVATVSVRVTADDGRGGTATDTFDIAVTLPGVSLSIAADIVRDGEDIVLTLTRTGPTTSALTVRLILGEVPSDNRNYVADENEGQRNVIIPAGAATVSVRVPTRVEANTNVPDGQLTSFVNTSSDYTIEISNRIVRIENNTAPTVALTIPDQVATVGEPFSYRFAPDTFYDDDNDPLSYWATLADGSPLPAWLHFTPIRQNFWGTPGADDVGTVNVRVTANDGSLGSVSTGFGIEVVRSVLTITADTASVTEGEDAVFTAHRTGPVTAALTVTIGSNELGYPDQDFIDADRSVSSVTFPAGAQTAPLRVPTDDDAVDEPDNGLILVSFTLDPTSNIGVGTPQIAFVTVNDNDDPSVTLSVSGVGTAAEGGSALTLTATRSAPNLSGRALVIPIGVRTTGTTAQAEDYTLADAIRIADGASSGTTTFTALDDSAVESVETVVVELGTLPAGSAAGVPRAVTITIADNDATNVHPTVANAIPDQIAGAGAGLAFSFAFAANTFSDADTGDTLTYTATLDDGTTALPGWLTFTPGTRTFSGTPGADDVGPLTVRVRANDGNGGTAVADFGIDVRPVVTVTRDTASVLKGEDAVFTVARTGPTGGALRVTLDVGSTRDRNFVAPSDLGEKEVTIPADAATLTYRVPTRAGAAPGAGGFVTVTVVPGSGYALDFIGGTFNANVPVINNGPPTVATAILDQTATTGTAFRYVVPQATFSDGDGDALSYTATLADDDGSDLPSWLTFTPDTRTFSGTPGSDDMGTLTVRVTADDSIGGTVSDEFSIVVSVATVTLSVSGNGAVTEGGGPLTITATRSAANNSGAALSIPIRVRATGTTAQAADYTALVPISIADGASSGTTSFTVTDDSTDELVETVVVELGTLPGGTVAGTPGEITITITDNDATTVTLATPDAAATEENTDETAQITLTLGRGLVTGEVLSVPLSITGGIRGTDYTLALEGSPAGVALAGEVVTFTGSGTPSATVATVLLGALGDDDAADDSLTVSIPAASAGAAPLLGATGFGQRVIGFRTGTGVITVTDDDDPSVSLSVSGGGVATEGGALTITATRSVANTSGTALVIPIQVRATGTTATQTDDYTLAGTISIADGARSGTTSFTVVNDAVDEPAETVVVELGTLPEGSTAGLPGAVTITITDDDATTVTLATPDAAATEEDADDTAEITLTLGRALGVGEELSVPLIITGGTVGTDYTLGLEGSPAGVALTGEVVTFTGGATASATVARVRLSASGDADAEDETLTVSIPSVSTGNTPVLTATGLGGGATGSRTGMGVITVTDDDDPSVSLSVSGGGTAVEGGSALTITATLNAANTSGAALSIPIQVRAIGTTAVTADYTLAGTITIAERAASGTTSFTAVDDSLDEGAETVVVELGTLPDGSMAGTPDAVEITIADTDGPNTVPTVANQIPDQDATVGAAFSYVVPEATFSDADGDALSYTATSGSGTALPIWLTFTPATRTFSGTPTAAHVGGWDLQVTADDGNGGTVSDEFDINVTAAPLPVVTITASASVTEGAGEDTVFTLSRTGPVTAALTVRITVTQIVDTAIITPAFAPGDLGDQEVIIPIGARTALYTMSTVDDTVVEPVDFAVAEIQADSAYTLGQPFSAGVEVTDDDEVSVTLSVSDDGMAAEGGGPLTITATRGAANNSGADLVIPIQVRATGTTAQETDYALAGAISIAEGATSGTATFTAVDDSIAEDAETVVVELGTLPEGTGAGTPGEVTITITDNDRPTVTITAGTDVDEGTDAPFTLTRTGSTTAALTVRLTVSEIDLGGRVIALVAPEDEGDREVTIPAGAATASFTVPTQDNIVVDLARWLEVYIQDDPTYTTGDPFTAFVIVMDDDDPSVSLSVSGGGVATEGGALTITATRSAANTSGTALVIPIQVRATGTTATQTDDYTLAGTISIADGARSGTTSFTVADDSTDEPAETVVVELGTLPEGSMAGLPGAVTITITDDDATTVTLATPDAAATEEDADDTAEITLTLGRALGVGEELSVPLIITGGIRGTDYTLALAAGSQGVALAGEVVTFTGGGTPSATVARVRLSASGDDDAEDETLTVSIPSVSTGNTPVLTATGLGGGATGSRTGMGVITVTDDDDPSVSLSVSGGGTAVEGGSALTITATLNAANTSGAALSIPIQVRAIGTTAVTADYTLAGTITIAERAASGTTSFTAVDDSLDEGAETVVVELGTLPDGSMAGTPDAVEITIADTDGPNTVPTVANQIPDQDATVGAAFSYVVPEATFSDADGDALSYTATQGDSTALPNWLTFTPGARTFSGRPVADDAGTVTVRVTANDGNGGTVSDEFDITVTAAPLPVVTITGGSPVIEGADAVFTVRRTGLATGALTVRISVSEVEDLATIVDTVAPGDAGDQEVTIQAGSVTATYRVPTQHDTVLEPVGFVVVEIQADPAYTPGDPSRASVAAHDNDDPSVRLSVNGGGVAAEGGNPLTLTATRSAANRSGADLVIPIQVRATGTTAQATDYTLAGAITIAPGARSGTTPFRAVPDRTDEGAETVVVELGTLPEGSMAGIPGEVTITIADNDGPNSVPTVATAIPDKDATVGTAFSYVVPQTTFSDGDGDALSYTVTQSDGSALPGWLTFTKATRTFAGTPLAANTGTVTVRVTADDGNGGTVSDEFVITVSTVSAPALVFVPADGVTVAEGGTASYTVALATRPTAAVTVTVTNSDSGAVTADTEAGTNGVQSTLTFTTTDWNTPQSVTVTGVEDDDATDEDVTLTHSAAGGGYAAVTGAVTVTVTDDDDPVVNLSVSNSGAVTEGGGPLTITATRSEANTSGGALSIPIRVRTSGTTAQAADYTALVPISIADDATSGTTSFTVTDDDTDESAETVVVELGTLPEGTVAGTDTEVTITITDDDATTVTLATPDTAATEGDADETAQITLTLGRGLVTGEVLAVPLSIAGGTLDTDYTLALTGSPAGVALAGEVVTFTGGATATATVATVRLAALGDNDAEDDSLTVSIPAASSGAAPILTATGLSGGATGSRTGTGVIAIADDDAPNRAPTVANAIPDQDATVGTAFSYVVPANTFADADSDALSYTAAQSDGSALPSWLGFDADTRTLSGTPLAANTGPVTVRVTADDGNSGGTVSDDFVITVQPAPALVFREGTKAVTVVAVAEGGTTTYTVALAQEPTADVTVTITSDDAGAVTADTDTVTNGVQSTLTFTTTDWNTPQSVTVTGVTDGDTDNEDVTLTHTAAGGNYAGVTGTLGVKVTDTTLPALSIMAKQTEGLSRNAAGELVYPEEAGLATFTATLTSVPTANFDVCVRVTETGVDRVASASEGIVTRRFVTMESGQTSQEFTISWNDDATDEPDSVVTVEALAPSTAGCSAASGSYGLDAVDVADKVRIMDNDPTIVSLPTADATIAEGGMAEFTVTLGRALVAGERIDVPLSIAGTNVTTDDWSLALKTGNSLNTGVTLTGATTATPQLSFRGAAAETATLVLTGATDSATESTETITVALGPNDASANGNGFDRIALGTNVGGGADPHGTANSFDVMVTDVAPNSAPTVANAIPDQDATAGTAFSYVFPANTFADADSDALSYEAAQSDGSALPSWLTFDAETRTFSGTPLAANTGPVTVRVTADDGNSGGTVTDDFVITVHPAPALVFVPADGVTVAEGDTADYTVRLAGKPTADVTVTVTNSDSGAVTADTEAGTNGVQSTLTFTTTDWNTPQSVTVTGVEDDDATDEDVALTHSAAGGGYGSVTGAVTVTVTDDDDPVVNLSVSNSGAVTEGGGPLTITATRSEANTSGGALSIPIMVRTSGTTAQAADYTALVPISIADDATSGTATFTVVDDSIDEPVETVVVELGTLPDGTVAGTDTEVTITITDDDATTVTLATPDTAASEGDPSDTARMTLTLGRGLVTGEVLAVPLSIAGGTLDTDYTLALSGTPAGVSLSGEVVTFTGGATASATVATVRLSASGDADAEDDSLTVSIPAASSGNAPILTATGLSGGATGDRSGDGVITVTDDDTRGLVFVPADGVTVAEGGTANYTVALATRPTAAVTVTVTNSDSGAVTADTEAGTNGVQSTLTFTTTDWNTPQSVTVTGVEDDDATDEDVALTHSAAGGGYGSVTGAVTVTVTDDDDPVVNLAVSGGGAVTEGGGPLTITATRSEANTSGGALSIPIRVRTSGTTAQAADYTALVPISIADDASSGTTSFTVVDDSTDEPAETVVVELGTLPEGTVAGTDTEVTITITDDDATTVTLATPDTAATEGDADETARMTLTLGRGLVTGEVLAVPLSIAGGTVGTDYTLALSGGSAGVTLSGETVTFTGGATASATVATVLLTAIQDANNADETLTVSIPAASSGAAPILTATGLDGGATGSRTGNGVITITDNNAPTVATAIPDQDATVGTVFRYVVPANTFADADSDVLSYSATQSDGSTLPGWLSFTAGSRLFSGTPLAANTGPVTVRVTADDGNGGRVSDEFVITVHPAPNRTPTLATAIPDQDATVGMEFRYVVPANTFSDADSDVLSYSATLPSWLTLTGSRTLSGTPLAANTGTVTVRVTADDNNGGTVSDEFVITVHPAPALVLAPAEDVSVDEGDTARYTVRLAGKPTADVTVTIASDDPGAVTVADTDAVADGPQNTLSFTTTTWNTAQSVTVRGVEDDDATDEDVALTHTVAGGNYAGVTGTLAVRVSDDDMRDDLAAAAADAGLVRFGRTVGEQSVSAVRDRLSADRRQGFTGSLAGQALPSMDGTSASVNDGTARPPVNEAVNADAGPGEDISEDAELAGSGGQTAVTALRSWLAGPGDAVGAGAQVRALDATDIVAGTSFALTRETDGGGTLALWGRGVHSGFSGQQGGIDIDGRVTGFQLGADHARGDWTYGLMVSRSTGDIEYSAPQGGGEIGLDLTALVPYVGWDVTAGLSAWGTLGFGRGDMTLTPETPETPDGGAVLRSDIDWQMAAAGVEGILTPSTRVLGGAALNWHADALWTRTRADALPGRRGAPGGETTRLRFGLESRWQHSLASGGVLTPQLEMALRHDGGDAETGFGLEIGGGLDWSAPERGLSLGLSGRTLALHEDGSFGDWGVSVVLDYDPAPDTKRGFAARLSHDLGGSASGGAQALLGPESFPGLNEASGGGRWALEAAYGVSRGRGRVGSSYMALRGADAAEAARLGYRFEPDAPHAEDVSVDVWAEPALQDTTNPGNTNNHRLGMDLNWKW